MKFVELLELINDCRTKAEKQGWIVYDIIGCYAEPLGNGFFRTVTQEEFINIFKGEKEMKKEVRKDGHLVLDIEAHKKTDIVLKHKFTGWDGYAKIEGNEFGPGEFSKIEFYEDEDGDVYEVNWELYFYPEGWKEF